MFASRKLLALAMLLLLGIGWWFWPRAANYDWPVTNAPPTAGRNLIAFGDSLTEGVGADAQLSWPSQLGQLLKVTILNRGVRGDTTASALQRLQRDVLDAQPRLVIVGLGGNDFMQKKSQDAAFANLRQIIEQIQQRGALVILLGFKFPLGESWGPRYEELARDTGCAYVPNLLGGILGHTDLMSDGVHPNAQGYALIAQRIAPVLQKHWPAVETTADVQP